MPVTLFYEDILRVLAVITSSSDLEYAEDEMSLKILSRVAATFGKLESQPHLLFEYSLLLSSLSFSLFLSLSLFLFTCYLIVFIKTRLFR